MRLQTKSMWQGVKNLVPSNVGNEFINIREWVNGVDSGTQSLTSLSVNGDITDTSAGSGLIVTTPNGLHTYRIAIDNSGQITTQQVT